MTNSCEVSALPGDGQQRYQYFRPGTATQHEFTHEFTHDELKALLKQHRDQGESERYQTHLNELKIYVEDKPFYVCGSPPTVESRRHIYGEILDACGDILFPPTDEPPLASFAFAVGDQVAYRPTGEPCQITAVHPDPDEEFYSIRFAQGNERQTTRQKLDLLDAAVAPAEWSCSLCTLKNPGNVTVCGACETPKPNTAGAAAGPTGSVAAPVSSGATAASLARMPDDNSCLFHSIAYLLGGPGEDATALRRVIAGAVKRDPSRWNFGTLGKEPSEYVTFITNPIRWGGQVELCILSEHYRCEISVTDIQTG